MKPDVRFTWNGDFALAYQVVGKGRDDLVYLPGYISNVDLQWDVPPYARFLERLASFSRLILMDRRGVGCSDRLPPGQAATLEEQVSDVVAVMDTVGARRGATVFAEQETAFIAMLLAATRPRLVSRLVLFCATPSWARSEELHRRRVVARGLGIPDPLDGGSDVGVGNRGTARARELPRT